MPTCKIIECLHHTSFRKWDMSLAEPWLEGFAQARWWDLELEENVFRFDKTF